MGEIERLVAGADDGTVDEEFLKHLYKGGELLAAGNPGEAREALEKAYTLQPKNHKAQNLLGLDYFKLGAFDRAADIYEGLVRDNPADPTLRVNLGLVYLKLNSLQRATRELETAVDLAPDHKKAQNYLGLAYAQAGDFARAKDCFVAAGSLTMAEKMERALKDPARAPRIDPSDSRKVEPEVPPESAPATTAAPEVAEIEVEPSPDAETDVADAVSAWASTREEVTEGDGPDGSIEEPPAARQPLAANATEGVEGEGPQASALPRRSASLSELSRALAVPAEGSEPFEVFSDTVVLRVRHELLTRLEGLVSVSGSLHYLPEVKRFRGKATEKAFGDGERRMVRVTGKAALVVDPKGKIFLPVELNDESAYFIEEAVFAFEETLVFENGRVPSKIAPDLHLIHLRGKGRVLLAVPGRVRATAVGPTASCAVPVGALVGWHGTLTPKIVGLPEERDGAMMIAAVELAGEGWALLTAWKL